MPKIRSSADLRNNYNDISTFCHTYAEPVFITKNGKGSRKVWTMLPPDVPSLWMRQWLS